MSTTTTRARSTITVSTPEQPASYSRKRTKKIFAAAGPIDAKWQRRIAAAVAVGNTRRPKHCGGNTPAHFSGKVISLVQDDARRKQ